MVYATLKEAGAKGGNRTVVLIPRARILAVGSQVGVQTDSTENKKGDSGGLVNRSASTETPSTVTLALTTAEAGRLTFAQEEGSTRLALLPTAGSKLQVPASVTLTTVSR